MENAQKRKVGRPKDAVSFETVSVDEILALLGDESDVVVGRLWVSRLRAKAAQKQAEALAAPAAVEVTETLHAAQEMTVEEPVEAGQVEVALDNLKEDTAEFVIS